MKKGLKGRGKWRGRERLNERVKRGPKERGGKEGLESQE